MSNETQKHILRTNCNICAHTPGMKRAKHRDFWGHLREVHNLSPDDFRTKYPNVKVHEHDETPRSSTRGYRARDLGPTVFTLAEPDILETIPVESVTVKPVARRKSSKVKRTIESVSARLNKEKPRLHRMSKLYDRIFGQAWEQMQTHMEELERA